MSKFINSLNRVVVSVSDDKDHRFTDGWKPYGETEQSETPDSTWKVADLRQYAEDNGIDLGDATKKADILAAISAGAE